MASRKKAADSGPVIKGRRDTRRGRFYDISNGEAYPSVTTVLSVLAKPALVGWAGKVERELVLKATAMVYEEVGSVLAEPLTPKEFTDKVEDYLGKARAATRVLREAADIGTQVHKWIEWDIKRMLLSPNLDLEVGAFVLGEEPLLTHTKAEESKRKYLAWKDSVRMVPLSTETQLVSHVHKYAGTEDIRLRIWPPALDPIWQVVKWPGVMPGSDGASLVVTGDFKTGKAVYGEMFLQNGAYRLAEIEMGIDPPSDAGIIIRLPKEETDPDFEVVAVPPLEKTIPTFLALRHGVWPWVKEENDAYDEKRRAREAAAKAA